MLSSFLLSSQGKQKKLDEGLDAIFATSAKSVASPTSSSTVTSVAPISGNKRKRDAVLEPKALAEVEKQAASSVESTKKRKKTENGSNLVGRYQKQKTSGTKHSSDKRKESSDTATVATSLDNPIKPKDKTTKKESRNTGTKELKDRLGRKEKEEGNEKKEKLKSTKRSKIDSDEDEDQAMEDLEERYLRQKLDVSVSKAKGRKDAEKGASRVTINRDSKDSKDIESSQVLNGSEGSEYQSSEDATDGEDLDPASLVHETVSGAKSGRSTKKKKVHYVPENETKEQRDQRTVFIGNLPPDVLKSKSAQKALKRHLLSSSSKEYSIEIESTRFRSVAFKKPTNLPELKEGRRQDRAVAWKNNTTTNSDPDGDGTPSKTYITPAEKKRIAFIKGEFHEEAGSTNAYAVIAHPHPHATSSSSPSSSKDPDKKSSNEAAYDPYIAAGLLVEKMNGTHFMGRTLRLDRVGRHPGVGVGVGSNSDAGADAISTRDPAATIFVGNLDFTAKEEDVRAFFETLLTVEIGPARAKDSKNDGENNDENDSAGSSSDEDANPSDNKMDIDSENKLHWVRSVRIVRDKDTQLGKGFAYIRFSERTCVDEILAMEPSKLKFAKRKLRIQRCKTNTTPSKLGDSNQRVKNSVVAGTAPANGKTASLKLDRKLHKGDPLLGERIKSLSREERKEVKKQDANRLARRMEKKGKRRALDSASRAEKMKDIKERIRVRKTKDALPFKARSRSHQDSKAGRSRKSGKHNQANA